MRKVVLYIAVSLDGFIADANGDVSWIGGDGSNPEDPGTYQEFYDCIDTVIIGKNTYNQIVTYLSPDKWVYGDKTSYILTHHKNDNTENIIFTDDNISDLICKIRQNKGKDIWVCGGADIANQFISKGLIDRYWLTIVPVILGNGIRLFSDNNSIENLNLVSCKSYNGFVDLIYDK
jgi:dihydrofolate reductase